MKRNELTTTCNHLGKFHKQHGAKEAGHKRIQNCKIHLNSILKRQNGTTVSKDAYLG